MSDYGQEEVLGYECMTPNCGGVSPVILERCPLCGQRDWKAIVERKPVETKKNPTADDILDDFGYVREEYLPIEEEYFIRRPDVSKRKFEIRGSNKSFQKDRTGVVSRYRIIDRENDRYVEKVIYNDSGAVIRDCDQKLTDHWGHGSAKAQGDESSDNRNNDGV